MKCPIWEDGQHAFSAPWFRGNPPTTKRCECGATVRRLIPIPEALRPPGCGNCPDGRPHIYAPYVADSGARSMSLFVCGNCKFLRHETELTEPEPTNGDAPTG